MSRLQLCSTVTAAALILAMIPGAALAEPSSSEMEDAAPVMTMPLTDSEGTPTETATALVDDPSAAHSPDADAAAQSDSALAQTTDAPESGTSEGGPIAILTEPLSVDNDFLVAGVTWGPDQQLAADSEISIRVREDGRWSDWYPMGSDGSGRDDGVGRSATEPFITGGADAVQVQVTGEAVDLPADLAVTMVPGNPQGEVTLDPDDVTPAPADPTPQAQVDEDSDADETVPQETSSDGGATVDQSTKSGTIPSDQSSTDGPSSGSGGSIGSGGTGVRDTRALLTSVAAASTAKDLPVNVITRAQWGANESYMTWDPEEATAPFVIVHHTVGTNNYSASQSAGIVNSIYYYHAVTLDWGDIGYNFLVDKYGQVFEGRAGSASATPGKMVAGAHAQGANTGTMGIAMMGTYTTESPTSAELTAVGKMAGWQLSRAGVDPRGSAQFTITYDNGKYQKGKTLTLNRILGHRDVYATACPGDAGYSALETIRSIASTVSVVNDPQGVVDAVTPDSAAGTIAIRGWAFDKDTTDPIRVHIYLDGTATKAITADGSRPDVQRAYSLSTNTVGYDTTIPATPGTHTVCAYAINIGGGSNQLIGCKSTGFVAGDIISDAVMFNSNTMTASEIQSFLTSKGSSCSASSSGVKCLKDYTVTTSAMSTDYCSPYNAAANETAAAIIWKSATACGVNPQALLVMLQKEQGLLTASGSSLTATRYTQAMGFQLSNTSYANFPAQVYYAASRLVQYGEQPNSFNYRSGQTVAIPYFTNASCGSSTVTIANRATAALYNYTPYQPNAAALANMYGTGDSCSTYGNRNFWRYFTDWFGSTH